MENHRQNCDCPKAIDVREIISGWMVEFWSIKHWVLFYKAIITRFTELPELAITEAEWPKILLGIKKTNFTLLNRVKLYNCSQNKGT